MSGLADDERELLMGAVISKMHDKSVQVVPVVEAIIAAHEAALRATIAQEIEAGRDAANWAKTFRNGLDHAASIVRGRCA